MWISVISVDIRWHPLASVDPGCGIVDVLLQLSIYVALDILPLVRFMMVYFSTGTGQLGQARAKGERCFRNVQQSDGANQGILNNLGSFTSTTTK